MATARVGISGWRYPPWRGDFYPTGLPQRSELAFASEHLSSIEINGSFYSLQLPSSFQRWYDETPDDFVFSIKGPRYITHMLHLRNAHTPLANFYASGVLSLREKLGPTLWQLPPRHPFDAAQLETFFAALPRTTGEALALARTHDERLDDRAWLEETEDRPLRHALEVRHPSFESAEVPELLRARNIAVVIADTAGKWPMLRHVTSDFVYLRLHGADELYTSGYTEEALDRWAADIRGWMTNAGPAGDGRASGEQASDGHASNGRVDAPGRDAFVYFDNDVKVRAPYDAMSLMTRLPR